jgi:phosphoribosylanthranilate isomerase
MKIKVCGLKDPENIKAVAALAPDYMGFICYNRSPRYIGFICRMISKNFRKSIKTGVFVNEDARNKSS